MSGHDKILSRAKNAGTYIEISSLGVAGCNAVGLEPMQSKRYCFCYERLEGDVVVGGRSVYLTVDDRFFLVPTVVTSRVHRSAPGCVEGRSSGFLCSVFTNENEEGGD